MKKTAYTTACEIVAHALLPGLSIPDATDLVRAGRTLHRWAELECGTGNAYVSQHIERDETTGKPRLVISPRVGKTYSRPIPDREAGALKRIKAICARLGLHYHHQTDPRGCALYVSREPLTDSNYTRGIAIG